MISVPTGSVVTRVANQIATGTHTALDNLRTEAGATATTTLLLATRTQRLPPRGEHSGEKGVGTAAKGSVQARRLPAFRATAAPQPDMLKAMDSAESTGTTPLLKARAGTNNENTITKAGIRVGHHLQRQRSQGLLLPLLQTPV